MTKYATDQGSYLKFPEYFWICNACNDIRLERTEVGIQSYSYRAENFFRSQISTRFSDIVTVYFSKRSCIIWKHYNIELCFRINACWCAFSVEKRIMNSLNASRSRKGQLFNVCRFTGLCKLFVDIFVY